MRAPSTCIGFVAATISDEHLSRATDEIVATASRLEDRILLARPGLREHLGIPAGIAHRNYRLAGQTPGQTHRARLCSPVGDGAEAPQPERRVVGSSKKIESGFARAVNQSWPALRAQSGSYQDETGARHSGYLGAGARRRSSSKKLNKKVTSCSLAAVDFTGVSTTTRLPSGATS